MTTDIQRGELERFYIMLGWQRELADIGAEALTLAKFYEQSACALSDALYEVARLTSKSSNYLAVELKHLDREMKAGGV